MTYALDRNLHHRLRQLPPVFSQGRAIQTMGWSVATGRQLLSRWSRLGHITAMGPRAGVYANKPADQVTRDDRLLALWAVSPSALLIGATAYSVAGATNLMPRTLEVAVLRDGTHPELDGVRYYPRPPGWYRKVAPGIETDLVVPRLRPEWAWIDAHANPGPWKADPDDVDFSASPDALDQLQAAAQALKVALPRDLPML
jgi:hypothetical protein